MPTHEEIMVVFNQIAQIANVTLVESDPENPGETLFTAAGLAVYTAFQNASFVGWLPIANLNILPGERALVKCDLINTPIVIATLQTDSVSWLGDSGTFIENVTHFTPLPIFGA